MPIKILGVNQGTRYLGIAFFQGYELRDWGVKVIEGKWSKEKMEKAIMIVSSLIEQYQPDALAIKRLHISRSSPSLNILVERIKELAKIKGLTVYQYSIKELEAFFSEEDLSACNGGSRSNRAKPQAERINKKKLAEIITKEYPALLQELEKEKSHRNPYHIRMFEAVALGKICFHHLDKPCRLPT